jgi:formate dehydrogenase maturation protein FdhE
MKIKVGKCIVHNKFGDHESYKIINIERCCDKLINSKNISLNTKYDEYENYDIQEYSVKLIRNEEGYDEYRDTFYEKINYCPFCGSKIIIEIVNEVDKTEEYKNLEKEREALWKKCCKTDSKKKAQILNQQVRELDGKINNILDSDDFIKKGE